MSDERQKELANVRRWMAEMKDRESRLLNELGEGDVIAEHKAQEKAAQLFDQLSPAELTRLYREDRARWDQIMRAAEDAGMRKLLES